MYDSFIKRHLPELTLRQQQTSNIVMITFWSQFASYALSTILILFLTRPFISEGLGYSQTKAYAFIGISQATGYLMPILGGYMADTILGLRRSILLGSIMLALAYLFVMLSGYTIKHHGDFFFIAAYALTPAANSLLIGTASGMVSRIHSEDAIRAKTAMTYYYMAINIGALLATLIAPTLLDSRYGPLSVLALTFVGKSFAALNFAYKYPLYTNVIWGKDTRPLSPLAIAQFIAYIITIYVLTLFAYAHILVASILIGISCGLGIVWFLIKTLALSGLMRIKQFVALVLILEAIVFFIIYNQMNSTLVLFAANNSNQHLFNSVISPAQYQMLNPLLIIVLGFYLPRFYQKVPRFSIPYQFATGTFLAGIALLLMAFATTHAQQGLIDGNYIAITYLLISLAELWVSAIGLSMIGLYCDEKSLAFAMGVWYLASSLSSAISGQIARFVALPDQVTSPLQSLSRYHQYYLCMGITATLLGCLMLLFAYYLHQHLQKKDILLP